MLLLAQLHHALVRLLVVEHAVECVCYAACGVRAWTCGRAGLDGRDALQGIETIVEDVLHVDPEWYRLGTLPGVQEGWAELKVKAAAAISECQARPRRHRSSA